MGWRGTFVTEDPHLWNYKRVCACVFWSTLAAKHLTASFLCAVLSLVPAAALWLGWESAGCLEAAFPCLSPPEQSTKQQQTQICHLHLSDEVPGASKGS